MPAIERGAGSFADEPNQSDESDAQPWGSLCSLVCGKSLTPLDIRAHGNNFVDQRGRNVTLRGVNLAGSSKQPTRPASQTVSHKPDVFFSSAETVSFVGRPFPLSEADMQFGRLRAYGCNIVRLIVIWEAIEHAGPGKYDYEYISYIADIVRCAATYGIQIYVDPHQDVWSRFSGGDGAPAWTFAAAGLDVTKFESTGAALVHATFKGTPLEFPRMCWPTNMHKLACGTMFTLFFGGATYAPKLCIDGENIQWYLQRHYVGALSALAGALRDCPNVIGFGCMNEPLPGFLGVAHLDKLSGPLKNQEMPTPFQGMALGSGYPTEVGVYTSDLLAAAHGMPKSYKILNAFGERCWLPGYDCVWRQHGVWGLDKETGEPALRMPTYFADCDFSTQCFKPFAQRCMRALRAAGHPQWLCFVELPPADLGLSTFPTIGRDELPGMVHAPHFYDQLTLFLGRNISWAALSESGTPVIDPRGLAHINNVRSLASLSSSHLGGVPTLIGEVGIPFDMQDREAYDDFTGRDLSNCKAALLRSVVALESNNLSYTLWTYEPTHTETWGDGWNLEDLSLYSANTAREVPDDLDPYDVYLGGRALTSFVRPYAVAVAGTVQGVPSFDDATSTYKLIFTTEVLSSEDGDDMPTPTLIFIPEVVQYPKGFVVNVSDGEYERNHASEKMGSYVILEYTPACDVFEHTLTISPMHSTTTIASYAYNAASTSAVMLVHSASTVSSVSYTGLGQAAAVTGLAALASQSVALVTANPPPPPAPEITYEVPTVKVGVHAPLPPEARDFLGTWTQLSVDNYEEFLADSVGLSWALRKVAVRIKPSPTWTHDKGADKLCVRVNMIGAKPILESYGGGTFAFEEEDANVKGAMWSTRVWWEEGGVLCSEKRSNQQNKGRPIKVRRWVTQAPAAPGAKPEPVLMVTQEWAPGKVFTQRLVRASGSNGTAELV